MTAKRLTLRLSQSAYDVYAQRAADQRRTVTDEVELFLERSAETSDPPPPPATGMAITRRPPAVTKPTVSKPVGRPPQAKPNLVFPVDWADQEGLDPGDNQTGLAGVYANGSRYRVRVLNTGGTTEIFGPFDTPIEAAQVRRDYYKAYGLPPGSLRQRKQLQEAEEARIAKLENDYVVGFQIGLTAEQIRESIFVSNAHVAMANAGIRFGTEPDDRLSEPVAVDLFAKYHKRFLAVQEATQAEMERIRADNGLPPLSPKKKTFADYPGLKGAVLSPPPATLALTASTESTEKVEDADFVDGPDPGEFDASYFTED